MVDCPSAYNVIVGRTVLNEFKAIPSTYYLKVKFLTPQGIGEARGDQQTSRECYMAFLKGETKEALMVEELEVRDDEEIRKGDLVEELEEVELTTGQSRTVKIGTAAPEEIKKGLRNFLKQRIDVFA